MTAIAYRDGIMAADTAVWSQYHTLRHMRKVVKRRDGAVAAAAGNAAANQAFQKWFLEESKEPFDPKSKEEGDFIAIVAEADGTTWKMDWIGRRIDMVADFLVEGACDELLCGAMAAGATAEEAIRIAIRHSAWAAGDVDIVRVGLE